MDLVTRQGNGVGEYESCETNKLLYAVAEAVKVCTEYASIRDIEVTDETATTGRPRNPGYA
jgi:hypothetical protein